MKFRRGGYFNLKLPSRGATGLPVRIRPHILRLKAQVKMSRIIKFSTPPVSYTDDL